MGTVARSKCQRSLQNVDELPREREMLHSCHVLHSSGDCSILSSYFRVAASMACLTLSVNLLPLEAAEGTFPPFMFEFLRVVGGHQRDLFRWKNLLFTQEM